MTPPFAGPVAAEAWWQPRTVTAGHGLDARLGPLRLQIYRGTGEWHVSAEYDDEPMGETLPIVSQREGGIEGEDFQRFIFAGRSSQLRLSPLLADRPVVIRPRQPVTLPSGEEATMYLSSPLSLRIEVGEPAVLLCEISMLRLSDTWFGPSTREGELCYSGKTNARHTLSEVPHRAHRAITALHIKNEATTPLPLDKISLPVPVLSVYGAADSRLWTQTVTMIRGNDTDMAALRIERAPPAYAGRVELISGPRREQARGGLVRAFNVLFGEGQ